MACHYKQLNDGRRQIISFFVPGDLCDTQVYILREMEHSMAALTSVRPAGLPRASLDQLAEEQPRVIEAL